MGKLKKISIIILTHNSRDDVLDCLKSLKKVRCLGCSIKLIVVDNASSDNSLLLIKKNFPKLKIIKNKRNLGFAGGNNVGIKWSLKNDIDYVILLNPDTRVSKNFLKPLIRLSESERDIGITAPVLKSKVKRKDIFALGLAFNPYIGRTKHSHLNKKEFMKLNFPFEQQLVSGCCMLIKKQVFKKIGLFDQRFFLYFEDMDFCLRAKKAGFKIFVEPKSIVFHKSTKKSFKKIYYLLKSNFLFIVKHVRIIYLPFAFVFLIALSLKMIIDKVLRQ